MCNFTLLIVLRSDRNLSQINLHAVTPCTSHRHTNKMPPTISPPEYSSTSPTTTTRDACVAARDEVEKNLRVVLPLLASMSPEEVGAHIKAIADACSSSDPAALPPPANAASAVLEQQFADCAKKLIEADAKLAQEAQVIQPATPGNAADISSVLIARMDQMKEDFAEQTKIAAEQAAEQTKIAAVAAEQAAEQTQQIAGALEQLTKKVAELTKQAAQQLNGAAAGPAIDVPDSVCVTGALFHPSYNIMNKDKGDPEVAVDGWVGVYDPVILRHGKPTLVHGQQLYRLGKEDKYLAYCTAGKYWSLKTKEGIMSDGAVDTTVFIGPESTSVTSSGTGWRRGVYTVQENGEYKSGVGPCASMKIQTKSDQPVYVKDSDPAAGVDVTGLYEPTGEIRNGAPVFQLHGKDLVLELSTVFDEGGSYVIAQPPDADGKQTILYVKSGRPNHHDSSSWYTCNYTAGGTPVRAKSSKSNFTVKPSLSLYD